MQEHGDDMSSESEPTRKQKREAARAARVEAERAQSAAALRRRRFLTLGAVLAAAAVVVVVAIVVSSGGGGGDAADRPQAAQTASGAISGQKESGEMLAGIPQKGIYLGKSDAPVRLVEFADLQCPICREYALQSLPQLVQDYVRTGKVRMEFRNLSFLGDDSVTAGRAAAAAAQQNKLWNFTDVLYYNQGEENSGYVTQSFVDRINKAAGVDSAEADAYAKSAASKEPLGAANTLANQYAVDSTPTILVGKRGGDLKAVDADATDVSAYESAIDALLGQAAG
jgi:protein-disulfide isomerase